MKEPRLTAKERLQIEKGLHVSQTPCAIAEAKKRLVSSVVPEILARRVDSDKSAYGRIAGGLLSTKNGDLPRKMSLKPRKGKSGEHKVDFRCRLGRIYADNTRYFAENPGLPVTEMGTVEGVKGGEILLTFQFMPYDFMLVFLLGRKCFAAVFADIRRCLAAAYGEEEGRRGQGRLQKADAFWWSPRQSPRHPPSDTPKAATFSENHSNLKVAEVDAG
jgi:hypothetical protein